MAMVQLKNIKKIYPCSKEDKKKKGDKYVLEALNKEFEITDERQEMLKNMKDIPNDVTIGVRPVHIQLSSDAIDGKIELSEMMGSELHLHVKSVGEDVVIVAQTQGLDDSYVKGTKKDVVFDFKPGLMHVFDKNTEKNIF